MTEITPALRDWMTRVVTPLQNCVVLVKSLMHTYTSAAHNQFTDLVQAQRGAHALPVMNLQLQTESFLKHGSDVRIITYLAVLAHDCEEAHSCICIAQAHLC